jgi:hypothetical protein
MAGEETIAALLAIWDEGQSSSHWPALLPVLRQLVDQFQQNADDDTRADIAMRITDLLRETDPDLHRKLIQMRRTIRAGEAHNRFSTRGMPSGAELSAAWQEIRTREASIYGESITTGNISGTGIAIRASPSVRARRPQCINTSTSRASRATPTSPARD